jgi:hypothetical protein
VQSYSLQTNGALHGWQYLFILEGCVPILLGLIIPFVLAKDVSTAWYLSPEQRAFGKKRMIVDSSSNAEESHQVKARDFKEAFLDWRVWAIMLSNTLASLSSQGFTIFFPVVVKVIRFPYSISKLAECFTNTPYSRASGILQALLPI